VEFRHFLQTAERATPAELDLHLVLNNASTHKSPIIQRWLLRHPRVHLHFTPTSASWINLVECRPKGGRFRSTRPLENPARAYVTTNNVNPKPVVWKNPAEQILQSVAEFAIRTSESRQEDEVLTQPAHRECARNRG
jgi:hypothetical protein